MKRLTLVGLVWRGANVSNPQDSGITTRPMTTIAAAFPVMIAPGGAYTRPIRPDMMAPISAAPGDFDFGRLDAFADELHALGQRLDLVLEDTQRQRRVAKRLALRLRGGGGAPFAYLGSCTQRHSSKVKCRKGKMRSRREEIWLDAHDGGPD